MHFDFLSQLSGTHRAKKIVVNDFLIFNQQFNTLVKAGLPILKALDLLAERAAAPRLRPILDDVRQRVREGALLSEALAAQGSFPPVYVTVIAAGERSGNLTGVLDQYISYLRVSTGFRKRSITALIYPAILSSPYRRHDLRGHLRHAAICQPVSRTRASSFPRHTAFLLSSPCPCAIIFSYSRRRCWSSCAVGMYIWTRSDHGALAIDRLKPQIPVFGDIWLKSQVAQFVRTLSTLLAGGTPLVAALQTSAAAIGSRLIATSVESAAERVREGQARCMKALPKPASFPTSLWK